jgi:hypothetical protein
MSDDTQTLQSGPISKFDDVEYIDIDLAIVDKAGGQFRTDAKPPQSAIVMETGILVRYGLVDTIHGKLSSTSSGYCSILVFDFQFDITKNSRAIHRVNIDAVVSDPGREIGMVAPAERVSLNPHTAETSVSGGVTAGYSGLNANARKEKKIGNMGYATVKGWAGHLPINRRLGGMPCNCAKWVVLENPETKDGIPASLRLAFQVLRSSNDTFQLDIILNVDVDWRTKLESMFGATPPNYPVIVNPLEDSTSRIVKNYTTDNLGLVELKNVFKVSYGSLVDTFSDQ